MAMWLEWALTSSFLILVVLLLRGVLGRHISACLRYALWAVVLLRLLVPAQLFTAPVSVSTWSERYLVEERSTDTLPRPGDVTPGDTGTVVPALPGQSGEQAADEPAVPADVLDSASAVAAARLNRETVSAALGWLWLGGAVLVGLVLLASNLRFGASLRRRTPLKSANCSLPVYVAEGLPSPCLFGLFRPAIYVTPETAQDPVMLRHVLAHEQTHARHWDHVWSALRCLALATHWWNPLVWLAVVLSRRDGELACDEGALKRLGGKERTAYGHTLLALTVKPSPAELLHCATTMTGGKNALRERVKRIVNAPKRLLWAVVLAVAVAVFAAACAFARAAEPEEPLDPEQTKPEWGVTLTVRDITPTGLTYKLSQSVADTKVRFMPGHPLDGPVTGSMYSVQRWDEASQDWQAIGDKESYAWTTEARLIPREETVDWSRLYGTLEPGRYRFGKPVQRGTGKDLEHVMLYAPFIIPVSAAAPTESIKPTESGSLLPSPAPTAAVPEIYRAVLLGEEEFQYVVDEEFHRTHYAQAVTGQDMISMNISQFPAAFDPFDSYTRIWNFAVADLDGDGEAEVVLWVVGVGNDMGCYLVLHREDGTVYGYCLSWRDFVDLKTDGTYSYHDGGMTEESVRSLSFSGTEYTIYKLVCAANVSGHIPGELDNFTIGGQPVPEEEYRAARERQAEKTDAVWYEFTQENIESALPLW